MKNLNFLGQFFSSQSIQFGPAMIYNIFISGLREKRDSLIENLEENLTQEFLPKCKASGLRKIAAFTVNFSPLKAYSFALQWYTIYLNLA